MLDLIFLRQTMTTKAAVAINLLATAFAHFPFVTTGVGDKIFGIFFKF